MDALQTVFLTGVVLFVCMALFSRDLLKAAISLGVASIFLALVFFHMHAVYAGVFEISVVAGLIMVLFIAAIGMTRHEAEEKEKRWPTYLLPLVLVATFVLAYIIIFASGMLGHYSGDVMDTFGKTLWLGRTFDLVGQIGAIFAGVVVVLTLFRKGREDE